MEHGVEFEVNGIKKHSSSDFETARNKLLKKGG